MKQKDYYIIEISNLLKRFDSDTVEAIYLAVHRLQKGGRYNGLQKEDSRINR